MTALWQKRLTGGAGRALDGVISRELLAEARRVIPQWNGYAPTPLISLKGMASSLGLGEIRVKYEAGRFGLGSFKALGGAFAVGHALNGLSPEAMAATTVATASDGNHGLSVAWGAKRYGCRCRIYLHENVSEGRADLIRAQGAQVVRVRGNYDDSTHQAKQDCLDNGWVLVSDTAIAADDEAPSVVMAGYSVMADEVVAVMSPPPTHVFVQGGCGGLAAAVFGIWHEAWGDAPRFIMVEPEKADCLYQSAKAGSPVRIEGDLDTVMGGLSVGEVSVSAWKTIERIVPDYMIIPDAAAVDAMTATGTGRYGDKPLVCGDAGAAGLAGLIEAAGDADLRTRLGLDEHSRVLCIVTEGAVDADGYQALTGLDPVRVAEAVA